MSDLLQDGLAFLHGVRAASMAHDVTYSRGDTTATVKATVGRSVFETLDAAGLPVAFESRDFLIAVSELSEDFTEPAAGDRIEEELNATTEIFEVMAPGGRPAYEWIHDRRSFRIHTKHVGSDA